MERGNETPKAVGVKSRRARHDISGVKGKSWRCFGGRMTWSDFRKMALI